MEEWKSVKGYEGYYEVSNLGRVRSLDRTIKSRNSLINRNGKILKKRIRKGYESVNLRKNAKEQHFLVHRLVASAFLTNNKNKPYVNHIDGDKKNNNVNNLEWVTPLENTQHALKLGIFRNKTKKIEMYSKNGELLKEFDSAKLAAEYFGKKSKSDIYACCRGEVKAVKGYVLKFA